VVPYLRDRPPALDGAVVADGSAGPEDVAGLLALLDGAWLELAMPISRTGTPDEPDLVAFELTPGRRAADGAAAGVALHIRDALAGLGLRAYALAREEAVLHVCVPVAAGVSYAETATFARAVAGAVCRAFPSDAAVAPSPVPSAGVLIDWRANAPGGTIPVPYVVRAGGRVAACPVTWDELDASGAPFDLGPAVVAERVERLGDLFAPVLEGGQDLGRHLGRP
jgi:bifunctional non-homologous end joining protein LigD